MKTEKPREKMLYGSVKDLSDAELLQVLLGSGGEHNNVAEISRNILDAVGNHLYELESMRPEEFFYRNSASSGESGIKGIGPAKACLIVAAVELGVRVARGKAEIQPVSIENSSDVKALFIPEMRSLTHEEFHLVMLNSRLEIIGRERTSSGGLVSACADPTKIFRQPIKRGCRAIIIAHNHPSGDPHPSEQDISTTRQLIASGKILGIELLDHIIVAGNRAFSFAEEGLIKK